MALSVAFPRWHIIVINNNNNFIYIALKSNNCPKRYYYYYFIIIIIIIIIVIDSKLQEKTLKNVVTFRFCLNFVVTHVLLSSMTWLKVPAL